MKKNVIGILRETKNKWERRVALTPRAVEEIVRQGTRVLVQPSTKRIFRDDEYRQAGAELTDDLSEANTIFGVKEFPPERLMPNKNYILFSHVIKAQPSGMPFLDACMEKNIRLFDYETIRAPKSAGGQRLVAFGRFAGVAGMIDTFRGTGERLLSLGHSTPFMGVSSSYMYPSVDIAKRAVTEMGQEITRVGLPDELSPMRFVFTGTGNVSEGAQEIFKLLPVEWVKPSELEAIGRDAKGKERTHVVYGAVATAEDMVMPIYDTKFDKQRYYAHPNEFTPVFHKNIIPHTSVLVNSMYWDPRFPRLLTSQQFKEFNAEHPNKLLFIGDITCDIGGSVEFLKRPCVLENPFFLYDPDTDTISTSMDGNGTVLMGVDNLPASFPREASQHFSQALMPFVQALASTDPNVPFEKASETLPPEIRYSAIASDGKLTPSFEYIANMRKQQSRKHKAVKGQHVENNIVLEGHLFDSNYINQALDLAELHCQDFKVVHWDISPNRAERSESVTRAVMQVSTDTVEKFEELVAALNTLASLIPASKARAVKSQVGTFINEVGERLPLPDEAVKNVNVAKNTKPEANVLVLGSGFVAGPLVEHLTRDAKYGVTVASLALKDAEMIAGNNAHASAMHLDAADLDAVARAITKADLVVSLLPATIHPDVAKLCIDQGKNMVTASYVSPAMKELHEAAVKAGITIMNEVGLDPGIDHMSALKIIREVKQAGGRITSFESLCGGLPAPEAADNPLGYKFSWAPLGALLASQNPATFKQDGKVINIDGPDLLSTARPLRINPAFNLEYYANRNSLNYTDVYGLQEAETMFRGTIRYQGYSHLLDCLVKIGFLDQTERPLPATNNWANALCEFFGVEAGETADVTRSRLEQAARDRLLAAQQKQPKSASLTADNIQRALETLHWLGVTYPQKAVTSPIEARCKPGHYKMAHSFCELLKEKLSFVGDERDLVLMHHRFGVQKKDGKKESITSTLISYGGDGGARPHVRGGAGGGGGWSAMARTVGLPAAIIAEMILKKQLTRKGVLSPMTPDVYLPTLEALAQQGIALTDKVTPQ